MISWGFEVSRNNFDYIKGDKVVFLKNKKVETPTPTPSV